MPLQQHDPFLETGKASVFPHKWFTELSHEQFSGSQRTFLNFDVDFPRNSHRCMVHLQHLHHARSCHAHRHEDLNDVLDKEQSSDEEIGIWNDQNESRLSRSLDSIAIHMAMFTGDLIKPRLSNGLFSMAIHSYPSVTRTGHFQDRQKYCETKLRQAGWT